MNNHIENTRRNLGELRAMSNQTDEAEKKILSRATSMLADIGEKLPAAKAKALTGEDEQTYLDLIHERGRLHLVIAQAKKHLHND